MTERPSTSFVAECFWAGVTEEDLDAMGFELPAAMRGKGKPQQATTAVPPANAFSCDSPDGE